MSEEEDWGCAARRKLAIARGLLISFTDPDPQYHPDREELVRVLKETEDDSDCAGERELLQKRIDQLELKAKQ
jgi:hypothetical protein